jgi:hypothetical protein
MSRPDFSEQEKANNWRDYCQRLGLPWFRESYKVKPRIGPKRETA